MGRRLAHPLIRIGLRAYFLLPLILTGCNCACNSLPCPKTFPGDPILGNVDWQPSYNQSFPVATNANPASEICVEFPGGLPPSGSENWRPSDWAAYFHLNAVVFGDKDIYQVYVFNRDCEKTLIDEDQTFYDGVIQQWTGIPSWNPGTWRLSNLMDDAVNNLPVGTNCKTWDDPQVREMVDVHFWDVSGIDGPFTLRRGEMGKWSVKVTGAPDPVTYRWTSDQTSEVGTGTEWSGQLVKATRITCEVSFDCPWTGPVHKFLTRPVLILPRIEWNVDATNVKVYPYTGPDITKPGLDDWHNLCCEDPCVSSLAGETWLYPFLLGDFVDDIGNQPPTPDGIRLIHSQGGKIAWGCPTPLWVKVRTQGGLTSKAPARCHLKLIPIRRRLSTIPHRPST